MRMLQSKESTGFIGIFRLCTDNLCQPYKKSQKIKVKSRTKLRNKTSRTMMIEIVRWWTAPRCRWGSQPRRNWTATWAKRRSRKPVWWAMWLPKDWTDFRYFVVFIKVKLRDFQLRWVLDLWMEGNTVLSVEKRGELLAGIDDVRIFFPDVETSGMKCKQPPSPD